MRGIIYLPHRIEIVNLRQDSTVCLLYTSLGIDIVFFDSEDYGIPEFYDGKYKQDTWCFGSQYWARTPHVQNYNARYGTLLDMVGGKDATFYYEGYSARTARSEMKKIWKKAHELGYRIDSVGTIYIYYRRNHGICCWSYDREA